MFISILLVYISIWIISIFLFCSIDLYIHVPVQTILIVITIIYFDI